METKVQNKMNDYLDNNNLLRVTQHGFRNKRSTVSPLFLSQNNYINCIKDKEALMLFSLILLKLLVP